MESQTTTKELFGLDRRAIVVFRISLALVTLYDVIVRAMDFSKFYADSGVFPIEAQEKFFLNGLTMNLYAASHHPAWQIFLLLLTGALCIAVIAGYANRVMWIALWALVFSLQNKNPFVNQAGDIILRQFYFWGIFLPWGLPKSAEEDRAVLSPATLAMTFQIAFIYFFSALLKSGRDWHQDATAVYYVMNIDRIVTPLAYVARQFPYFLAWITHFVWYIELLSPLLFFSPFRFQRMRTAAVLTLMGLHFSFILFLRIGTFPWFCIAGLTVLLPREFWDRVQVKLRADRLPEFPRLSERAQNFLRPAVGTFVGLVLFGAFLSNLGTLKSTGIRLPVIPAKILARIGMRQRWDMFAPGPPHRNSWMVVETESATGVRHEFREESGEVGPPPNYAKPKWKTYRYLSERELKFLESISRGKHRTVLRPYFTRYLCREGRRLIGPQNVQSVSVTSVTESIQHPGQPKRILLSKADCDERTALFVSPEPVPTPAQSLGGEGAAK